MKKRKIIACILLFCCLLSPAAAIFTAAEEASPAVYLSTQSTVRQNGYLYLYIRAKNIKDIGSLELYIFYPSDIMSYNSSWLGGLNENAVSNVNDEEGVLTFQSISADGITGTDGELWGITFRISEDAGLGTYKFSLAVGDVYDVSLSRVNIASEDASFTVIEKNRSTKNLNVRSSVSTQTSGLVKIDYYTSNASYLAAADFELDYDFTRLKLESFSLGSKLSEAENSFWSLNTAVPGYASLSYAATKGVSGSARPLVTAVFSPIDSGSINTTVSLKITSAYDKDSQPFTVNECMQTVTFTYTEEEILPVISLENYSGHDGDFTVAVKAEAQTKLAAGDFTVKYDASELTCLGVSKVSSSDILVLNPKYQNGEIRFSYICEDGIKDDTSIVLLKFRAEGDVDTELSITGKNLSDAALGTVKADFSGSTVSTAHSYTHYNAKAPTCTEAGWEAYDVCEYCGESTYVEIPALDHDFHWVIDKPATADETGLKHEECSRCTETRNMNTEIPVLKYTSVVSVANTAVNAAWSVDFNTVIKATQLQDTGAYFTLVYDTDIVKYKSFSAGADVTVTVDETNHTITVFSDSELDGESGSDLLTLTFTVSGELSPGDYQYLKLSADDSRNSAEFTGFTIFGIGDVNMDGKVNSRDVTLIKQSAVRLITLTPAQLAYADAYADGNVNSRDATIITQYVVHMEVTLGDRISVSFIDSVSTPGTTNTVIRSVRKGGTLTAPPSVPDGYAWSMSAAGYIAPVYNNITTEQKYYLVKKES